ncbi:hypothetical protein NEPAR06_2140 [Nematocida parisii]|uniref:NLE domain-containing protein n=1 Tax=Nematocida parisii (strain ERTm3) TaxID=935791 RepID=I3EF66_NEMP3|nr:uncharacterized protein NEPG_02041 [Nematocida parisii ERTm1]EIJ87863.1 hypothetical protein NEQG_01935 [Nematocida parisii ERTm3]KAI5128156.1 hypothetical protein NEPAR08_1071 [Nematocida parisii]EIJ93085.1 hypothetical protein NEPG_02041 [Nematocida parisii ERTm1]KAI5128397.1 hypothetical protein NEPAR03_1306 [Nematocida parisii]KAI5141675.1 hypothetical protein NEPAR04_1147 [Nematocida parisii]|eukprot:XP_013059868.1 hypothetical protein NEPG_02041 [Nematocida parisii ERTm1]
MSEVIVTFRNMKDKEFVTPPMQVAEDFSPAQMEQFLNSFLNQDKSYAFFYNGEQIQKIPECEKEQTLEIEFIAVTKIMSETAKIDVDSAITSISIRRNPEIHIDTVIVCTTTGETKEYSLGPGIELIKEFNSFKPIRAVTSTEEGIYVLTTTNKVVDIEKGEIVFEADQPIRTIGNCKNYLAIGLASDEIVILTDNKESTRFKAGGEIGKTIFRVINDEIVLIVAIIEGIIEIYKGSDWKKTEYSLPTPITAAGYEGEKIYAGGLGGGIYICSMSGLEKQYQSDVEFISRIECGTTFFGYSNKNSILLRDKENYTGTHKIELSTPVADIKISGKRLFVAEGSSLKMFNIFDE